MERRNGGCDRVVSIGGIVGVFWVGWSPMCGIEAMRSQWSLWLVALGVMVVSMNLWCAVGGRRMSRWSRGVLDGR